MHFTSKFWAIIKELISFVTSEEGVESGWGILLATKILKVLSHDFTVQLKKTPNNRGSLEGSSERAEMCTSCSVTPEELSHKQQCTHKNSITCTFRRPREISVAQGIFVGILNLDLKGNGTDGSQKN